jgi:DNA-binding CsgD family transcriptional regulator
MVSESQAFRLATFIYDAAEDPALWPSALDEIGTALNAPIRGFSVEDAEHPKSNISLMAGMDPFYRRLYDEHYESINLHLQRARPMFAPGRIIASHQVCSDRETPASEYYNDFLSKQRDWFHIVGGCVAAHGPLLSIVHFIRGRSSGAFSDKEIGLLELLMPHFQRAARLHGIFARGSHTAVCLDSLSSAVFLVSPSGKVEFMNRAAQVLIQENDGIGVDANGQLVCADKKLLATIARASQTAEGRGLSSGGYLPVHRPSDKRPYTVVVSPVRQTDPFSGNRLPGAFVFVVDPESRVNSIAGILRRTYNVTPAEARLAEILAEGRDLQDACEQLGILRTTARTHLQRLFEKLGVKRQAELVAVLVRLAAQLPNDALLQNIAR